HPDRRRRVVVLAALSALRRMTQNARSLAGVFMLAAAALGGCASIVPQTATLRTSLAPELHNRVELADVPFFAQDEYQCGPAALDMLTEISAGNPVIILQNLGFSESWHYAVAIGYDYYWGKLYLRSGTTRRQVMAFTVNEIVWMRSGYWAMVALPPDRIAATAQED